MARGSCKDYAEYQHYIGLITGYQKAHDIVKEVEDRFANDDPDD